MNPSDTLSTRRQALQTWLRWGTAATVGPAVLRLGRASSHSRFLLGVASGQPRPSTVVLWTRLIGADLPPAVPVMWEIARDEGFRQIVQRGEEIARVDEAHSVHAEPMGLEPGQPYWYRFTALSDRSPVGRTFTAPRPADAATLRLATASCQRYDQGHFAAWRDIAEWDPHLIAFLGDYIYETGQTKDPVRSVGGGLCVTLDDYRARYALVKQDPLLQRAHAQAPWVMVWDDHEVENDVAGLNTTLSYVSAPLRRAAAYRAYWEHLPFAKSAKPVGPDMRIWGALDWGGLARIHLLDGRQHRDLQACRQLGRTWGAGTVRRQDCPELADERRSLLGWDQERGLSRQWSTQHRWNLLAQQTLMAPLPDRKAATSSAESDAEPADNPDDLVWTDGWDGYAPARRRLLHEVAERHIPGLVVLGGDVHAHYAANLHVAERGRDTSAPVGVEFCGTSIASRGPSDRRVKGLAERQPQIRYAQGRLRGSVLLEISDKQLNADLRGVERITDPDSPVKSLKRFVVEAGRVELQEA